MVTDGSSEDAKEDYINLNVTRLILSYSCRPPCCAGRVAGDRVSQCNSTRQALSKLVQLCQEEGRRQGVPAREQSVRAS